MSDPPLTAAELLRRKAKRGVNQNVTSKPRPSTDSIDEEIKRLEQELQESNSDDESDSGSTSSSSSLTDNQASNPTCYNISKLRDDRIEPLPPTLLPKLTSKRVAAADWKNDTRPTKKPTTSAKPAVDPDIQQSVQDILQHYIPRSRDKLPFYCRYCQQQYNDLQEFQTHHSTELHLAAVQMERKTTYCKLCQKQMTSPTQMQEHLQSKPHKERLEYRKQMQSSGGGRGAGRESNGGRQQHQRQVHHGVSNGRNNSYDSKWHGSGRGNGMGRGMVPSHGQTRRGLQQSSGRGRHDTRQWK